MVEEEEGGPAHFESMHFECVFGLKRLEPGTKSIYLTMTDNL
jgi:hypothetical protein